MSGIIYEIMASNKTNNKNNKRIIKNDKSGSTFSRYWSALDINFEIVAADKHSTLGDGR